MADRAQRRAADRTISHERHSGGREAGGKSQVANLVGVVVIGVILVFFASLLAPLPSAALGAVVISAGVALFDVKTFRALWVQNRPDFWTGIVALIGALTLGLLPGIVLAVFLSLWILLMRAATTSTAVLARSDVDNAWQNIQRLPRGRIPPGLLVIRWESGLIFPNARGFSDQVKELVESSSEPVDWVLDDPEATSDADFTGTATLLELIRFLDERGVTLVVAEPNGGVR